MHKDNKETKTSFLALYGSLMSSFTTLEKLAIHTKLSLVGDCKVSGKLYDLGDYPGLKPSDDQTIVYAELYSFSDMAILEILDSYEAYSPGNEQDSLFKRELLQLQSPPLKAWVYIYNQAVLESALIKSGSWQQHLQLRDAR